MALQVTQLKRNFILKKDGKNITLTDVNEQFSPEEIAKFHATEHPELTNAIIEGPKVQGDKAVYTIQTQAGKLG